MQTCVIIGGGHAGAQACAQLRKQGWDGKIVLLGNEASLPYHRPPLSKGYLQGNLSPAQLLIRPATAYQQDQITTILDCRVTSINPAKHEVELADGSHIKFDKLMLCTGSRARRLNVPGADLAGVYYIKTLLDIEHIAMHLAEHPGIKHIGMIGGGYIGLETAAVLREMGHEVRIFEREATLLSRVTSPIVSAFYHKLHHQKGVQIETQKQIAALKGERGVETLVCSDGSQYPVDLVIVGVGAIANTELAEQAGLLVEGGVVVNEHCQTSHPDIYAAGDCTVQVEHHSSLATRIESVPNALEQAKAAAAAICGKPTAITAVPWFWSDQYHCKIQIAGLNHGFDRAVVRQYPNSEQFSVWYLKDGKIIAVDCINSAKDFMLGKRLVALKAQVPAKVLKDPNSQLTDWLTHAATI
ncbi:NAD(P)/FAD-dependent oxidoreductase [Pseudoalteromonas fenneropenaei]|uniref:NAD(P)/FAD-dependent oxidoreductase n=1 Tax=Pseudoalteromonas fenneropenaei TaxID=1737459 RepID=A0ABV7CJS0_9GAMM